MWVDNSNSLYYAVNSGSCHSDGFDAEKHLFIKIAPSGKSVTEAKTQPGASRTNANQIDAYELEEQNGQCKLGGDNHPDNGAKKALLEFSTFEIEQVT